MCDCILSFPSQHLRCDLISIRLHQHVHGLACPCWSCLWLPIIRPFMLSFHTRLTCCTLLLAYRSEKPQEETPEPAPVEETSTSAPQPAIARPSLTAQPTLQSMFCLRALPSGVCARMARPFPLAAKTQPFDAILTRTALGRARDRGWRSSTGTSACQSYGTSASTRAAPTPIRITHSIIVGLTPLPLGEEAEPANTWQAPEPTEEPDKAEMEAVPPYTMPTEADAPVQQSQPMPFYPWEMVCVCVCLACEPLMSTWAILNRNHGQYVFIRAFGVDCALSDPNVSLDVNKVSRRA